MLQQRYQRITRREFVALLGGAFLAFAPVASLAQQSRKFRLGYLDTGLRSDPTVQNLRRQFLLGLRDLSYLENRDFILIERSANGNLARLPGLAAEIVASNVDVIAAGGEAAIRAAKQATSTIPIVMQIAADPVGSGFVKTLAHPGGNITGLSASASNTDMAAKRLELLKEIAPKILRIAVLWNPTNLSKVEEWHGTEAAAVKLGVTLKSFEARAPSDLGPAFTSILAAHTDALLVLAESVTAASSGQIGRFAQTHRLPMVSEVREFAAAGGIASYGVSRPDLWRRSASYVDRIVRGAKPADIPVEQPTRFELVINLKAAKAIGLNIPSIPLTRADEVIE